ncbi:MAG: hypothetical protein GIW94_13680 [Candidatus Eremiobacteraeota bacterium]|nr:hypothetical protein [Candidatus Eremiobacteraeota bacterium]MBC5821947.1 hypothetical protein [Candidatus Eremiobacteraeota bacterium]
MEGRPNSEAGKVNTVYRREVEARTLPAFTNAGHRRRPPGRFKDFCPEPRLEIIIELYPEARVNDRRRKPQHGYRAIHIIVHEGRCPIEIQLRTKLQNGWVQYSEKLADMHGNELKYGQGDTELLKA